jgi:DNA-binding transcriptional MerR regulator
MGENPQYLQLWDGQKRLTKLSRKGKSYAINELAKKAQVSVRTIRFYVNEGLLPAPEARGRYTVYTEEYLDRLELIRRLKDSFLPLKEIRTTLSSLSWEEVQASLADLRKMDSETQGLASQKPQQTPQAKQLAEPRSTAVEYIAELLSSTPVKRPLPPAQATRPAPDKPTQPGQAGAESWQRIVLAGGLELHIRQPSRVDDQARIEQIIRLAKKLFSS